MSKRLAACISVTIPLLAAPAGAHAEDVVQPVSVSAATTVPAGGASTLTLRCPETGVALNAAVTRQGAGVSVRRSGPGRDSNDWRFRLTAAEGARSRGVRAVLRCVGLALPRDVSRARLDVSTQRPPAVEIPAGSSTAVRIGCARGFVGTGYGLERGARQDVTIAEAVPGARGWSFRLENTGASPASARLSVRCLKRVVGARRGGARTRLTFRVARPEFRNQVGPGSGRGFSNACTRRQFSVATGVSFDWRDDIALGRSHPAAPWAGVWTFRQASGTEEVRSFLVCLARRTQFG
jgi:hypothetical protein